MVGMTDPPAASVTPIMCHLPCTAWQNVCSRPSGSTCTSSECTNITPLVPIEALAALKRPCLVDLHTDSQYLRDGIMKWIHGWKRNGWRTADKKPVKNVELWQRLDAARGDHHVEWHWVRGHSGHPENERADALARAAIAGLRS
mgnify:CR=1 FL=1